MQKRSPKPEDKDNLGVSFMLKVYVATHIK
jgi:hypothetical protein